MAIAVLYVKVQNGLLSITLYTDHKVAQTITQTYNYYVGDVTMMCTVLVEIDGYTYSTYCMNPYDLSEAWFSYCDERRKPRSMKQNLYVRDIQSLALDVDYA